MGESIGIPPVVILANEANYASGPEVGNPIKITPIVDYRTPGGPALPQYENYWSNLLSWQDWANQQAAVTAALSNFDTPIAKATINASVSDILFMEWHPFLQKWICATLQSTNCNVYSSHDAGRNWVSETSASGVQATGMCVVPGGSAYVISLLTGYFLNQSGVLTGPVAGLTLSGTGNSNGCTEAIFTQGSGLAFVGISVSSGTYTGYYATGNITGTSWTVASGTLPAAWQTGTCHTWGLVSCQSSTPSDPSGPRTLVAMCGITPGTDTGRLLVVSAAGAFTDSSPSFLATKVVTGVAYGANDNLWGVLCHDGSNCYLYTSPDLSTWTLNHEFIGYTASGGLAVDGSVWAAQIGNGTDNRVMFSADVGIDPGSSQWGTANAFLTSGIGSYYVTSGSSGLGNLQAGANGQLVGWNTSNFHMSKQVGLQPQGAL